jgi:hypothetical protein
VNLLLLFCLQDRLQVSSNAQGVIELADEPSVAHLVTALGKDDAAIEVKQNRVFVRLLKDVEGSIDCIGASGHLYRVRVVPSQSAGTLSLRLPKSVRSGLPLPLELMRAMRLGRPMDGAIVTKSSAVVAEEPEFVVQLQWVYRIDDLVGFACTLRNRSGRTLDLDLSRIRGEGVLAIGARDLTLRAGEVTRLWVVVRD